MVVAIEARKITFSHLSSSSNLSSSSSSAANPPPHPISLLFDPDSLSLALMLSDSSISLHYPFLPFSSPTPNLPPPKTVIPPSTSSATFLHLASSPNPNASSSPTLLISAGTNNDGGSKILLRFLVKATEGGEFVRARVTCGHKGFDFDKRLGGIVVVGGGGDGVDGSSKIMLAGSVNYFAMYSASTSSVWVFGVKLSTEDQRASDGGEGDGLVLKLVKCAVINCTLPVSSICVSSGYLILGELDGVRVFPLRPLVKGKVGNREKGELVVGRENGKVEAVVKKKVNGEVLDMKLRRIVRGGEKIFDLDNNTKDQLKPKKVTGVAGGKVINLKNGTSLVAVAATGNDTNGSGVAKPKSLKLNQDSSEWGASFVPFSDSKAGGSNLTKETVSIHAISQQKFLILDSTGHVYLLHVSMASPCMMKELTDAKNIEQLAVLPAMPDSSQTVWSSNGPYYVKTMTMSYVGSSANENEITDSEDGKLSVTQVIFTSERIQEMIPLSADAILILGQDNLYAYAIS